jgi:hypothetical protein
MDRVTVPEYSASRADEFEHGKYCPGCGHRDREHVAGFCYVGGYCGWTIAGPGAYGREKGGWVYLKDYYAGVSAAPSDA